MRSIFTAASPSFLPLCQTLPWMSSLVLKNKGRHSEISFAHPVSSCLQKQIFGYFSTFFLHLSAYDRTRRYSPSERNPAFPSPVIAMLGFRKRCQFEWRTPKHDCPWRGTNASKSQRICGVPYPCMASNLCLKTINPKTFFFTSEGVYSCWGSTFPAILFIASAKPMMRLLIALKKGEWRKYTLACHSSPPCFLFCSSLPLSLSSTSSFQMELQEEEQWRWQRWAIKYLRCQSHHQKQWSQGQENAQVCPDFFSSVALDKIVRRASTGWGKRPFSPASRITQWPIDTWGSTQDTSIRVPNPHCNLSCVNQQVHLIEVNWISIGGWKRALVKTWISASNWFPLPVSGKVSIHQYLLVTVGCTYSWIQRENRFKALAARLSTRQHLSPANGICDKCAISHLVKSI